ncbi:MAG: hypothetical protein KGI33_06390 [Thaumarchaeota archaeon]|nr:hypothetical protein [Nitrososphaerota archaeon]
MVGLLPFLAPVYSVIVAVAVFLGIKVVVKKRKKQLQKIVGAGVCAVCGSKIDNNKCPKCDLPSGPEKG